MKKFLLKSSLFIVPFLLLHFLNNYIYLQNEGDLVRLGYIYNNPSPKSNLSKQFQLRKYFKLVSEHNVHKQSDFDVFIIGDSFSEQGNLGYKNFLAKEGISVLHMDRFLSENPLQKLLELINGGFFETVHPKYIVLQSAERKFIERTQNIDFSKSLTNTTLQNKIRDHQIVIPDRNIKFFSNSTINIPLINIKYYFNNKPKHSKTYRVTTNTNNLFTGKPNNLLFYQEDIQNITDKNDALKIAECNDILNKVNSLLSEKNIKLIVLISPDKYDMYYNYIEDKENLKEPLFFNYFNALSKDYISVNALDLLSSKLDESKDIYYYDDTHWSPLGAEIIAKEIKRLIN